MAKRSTALARSSSPTIRIAVPRSAPMTRTRTRTRSRSRVAHAPASTSIQNAALGGAALAFVEKSGIASSLPSMPMIGKKGTIVLAAYFLGKSQRSRMLLQLAAGGAAVCAYELAKDGKIDGEETDL